MIQEGVEFFPFSGKQNCSVEIQPWVLFCKTPSGKVRLMYCKILKGISSAKTIPNPQEVTWVGKHTLEEELVLMSSQSLTGDVIRGAAVRRGCVHTNKVLTPGTPSCKAINAHYYPPRNPWPYLASSSRKITFPCVAPLCFCAFAEQP